MNKPKRSEEICDIMRFILGENVDEDRLKEVKRFMDSPLDEETMVTDLPPNAGDWIKANYAPEGKQEPAKDHIDMPEDMHKAQHMLQRYHSKNRDLQIENSHLKSTFSGMEREIKALHHQIETLKAALKAVL